MAAIPNENSAAGNFLVHQQRYCFEKEKEWLALESFDDFHQILGDFGDTADTIEAFVAA
jgi:hypothetical protein